ncbi:uncharacterized protein TNCV_3415961, partial [Trichonephila clavipes]
TRGLLATDHVILNHDQVTWTTPELAPPLQTTTPHHRASAARATFTVALDRLNVYHCPTRRVFYGTWIELVTSKPRSDTLPQGFRGQSDIYCGSRQIGTALLSPTLELN